MFKTLVSLLALCALLVSGSAWAEESENPRGFLMPSACKARKGSPAEHTTRCALEPDCVATGFGLMADESFYSFDTAGNELALAYFKTTERTDNHLVEVLGRVEGNLIRVEKIVAVEQTTQR